MQSRQIERNRRGDLKWRSVRPQQGQHTVEAANDCESAFVDGAMMASAQEHKVVEARDAAVCPVFHVIGQPASSATAVDAMGTATRVRSVPPPFVLNAIWLPSGDHSWLSTPRIVTIVPPWCVAEAETRRRR